MGPRSSQSHRLEKPVLIMGGVRARAARRHTNKWTSPERGRRRFREGGRGAPQRPAQRQEGEGPRAPGGRPAGAGTTSRRHAVARGVVPPPTRPPTPHEIYTAACRSRRAGRIAFVRLPRARRDAGSRAHAAPSGQTRPDQAARQSTRHGQPRRGGSQDASEGRRRRLRAQEEGGRVRESGRPRKAAVKKRDPGMGMMKLLSRRTAVE